MSKLSDFWPTGSGTPLRVVSYTSGTGTFTPLVDQSRCMVRLQAGGDGGSNNYNAAGSPGGSAGAFVEAFIRVPIAGLSYAIGAGGAGAAAGGGHSASAGSPTTLGNLCAGPTVSRTGCLGPSGGAGGAADGSTYQAVGFGGSSFGGPPGGVGGAATAIGHTGGGGGGGSSFYGTGGTGGAGGAAGVNATGYGAGGGGGGGYGAGGAGSGGYIEIWEFGA